MRGKGNIRFILIMGIVLMVYAVWIGNLDVFMVAYDNKIEERKNPYYVEAKEGISILDVVRSSEGTSDIGEETIEILCENEVLGNLIRKDATIEKEEMRAYIEALMQREDIKKKDMEEPYGEVIHIEEETFALVFSMDEKHILYQEKKINEQANGYWAYKEMGIENKEEICTKVRQDLGELGVTKRIAFEPESIYMKYYYSFYDTGEDIYVMEDSVHKIKVEYDVQKEELLELQMGFQSEEI